MISNRYPDYTPIATNALTINAIEVAIADEDDDVRGLAWRMLMRLWRPHIVRCVTRILRARDEMEWDDVEQQCECEIFEALTFWHENGCPTLHDFVMASLRQTEESCKAGSPAI